MIKVTVWNEFHHEKTQEPVRKIYPEGIHECIAGFLRKDEEITVRTAVFDMPEHGECVVGHGCACVLESYATG